MALAEVYLTNDVYMACLQLALSTEKEEVICLLLGETKEDKGKKTVYIYSMKIPHRLDKKKDRVEISIDQLLATRDYAEKLSQQLKKEVTVIGWFHSHPHITVWPSHVDVNTQANYQTMSGSFVGIISSVFSEDKTTKECEVNLTCFQSESITDDSGSMRYVRKPIPFFVIANPVPVTTISCLKTICDLPNILHQEEEDNYRECAAENSDVLCSLHNEMLLTKSLLHITNKISIPLLKTLELRERILKQQLIYLKKFDGKLRSAFGGCQEGSPNSKH
ncbi:lys-63-specific deubiquitinase BRCC36-like isoform X1 [Homalodisca vitripennis]|uniref:lys-63-specific deubiquitinase BRCC36-like isoform X1 n=2 Tax=Homalodisca vitripennis TaxID=197043 RepID=UPI001EEBBF64|nr:lys-63-specific deubiquitinase BRCC36-like isoform X1 [Homalodisca vitripennis]